MKVPTSHSVEGLKTPCFVIDEARVEQNLRVLSSVMEHTGCKILAAQKAFSCYALYPLFTKYLSGATASGLYEAKLWHEYAVKACVNSGEGECRAGVENHIYSPAYKEEDIEEILQICNHIVFNSPRQLILYGLRAKAAGVSVGLRINPEKSTQEGHEIYDPCAPGSRLGTTLSEFQAAMEHNRGLVELLDGIHFHTLCEQDADALEATLEAVEKKFGFMLKNLKWINFGGGHHITREGYDIERLERCIRYVQDRYGVQVYLEPGEAVTLNAGYLYTTVLEILGGANRRDRINVAIVDTSAACHMPDVLEMPYRPPLTGSAGIRPRAEGGPMRGEKPWAFRIGGPTCLAGDVIGDYSFDLPLDEGDILEFCDMAIYSMVKTNTFNGMPLPSIYIRHTDGSLELWKEFGYEDFKCRL